MPKYDVTVDGNKLHLYYDAGSFGKNQLEKIRSSPYKKIGVVFHIFNGSKEEIYHIDNLEDISRTKYTDPYIGLKSPFGYVSPYSILQVSRSSRLMNRSTNQMIIDLIT